MQKDLYLDYKKKLNIIAEKLLNENDLILYYTDGVIDTSNFRRKI